MFTLLINFHPDIKVWQLVEPFWYHLQEPQKTILLEQKTMFGQVDERLTNKVLAELECFMPPKWQMVFITDLHISAGSRCLSLSEQINHIQSHLLDSLQRKGYVPSALWIIALDHEKRSSDGRPLRMESIIPWEIDRLGYLQLSQEEDNARILFHDNDFKQLDKLWGWPIEFNQAGFQVNNPDKEFLDKLQERNADLLNGVETLFEDKLSNIQNNAEANCEANLLTVEVLDIIKKDYKQIIANLSQQLFSGKLESFQPSASLEGLLRKNLGIEKSANGFRILRLEADSNFKQDQTYSMVQCAFLIGWIAAIDQDNYRWMRERMTEGNVYHIEIDNFKTRLEEILGKQYFCIKTAVDGLNKEALSKRKIWVPALDQGSDYTDSIALISEKLPEIRHFSIVRNSDDLNWKQDCHAIRRSMQKKIDDLHESVNKDLRNMKVVQRQAVNLDCEIDNIESYYDQIRQKQKEIKETLASFNPFQQDDIANWEKYTGSIEARMNYLLNSRPLNGTIIGCIFLAMAFLCLPFISMTSKMVSQSDPWKWIILPVIMLAMVIGAALLVRWRVLKPILQIRFQLIQRARELIVSQSNMAENCKKYLHLMHRALQVNKVVGAVAKIKEEHARENMLRQYHIRQLTSHMDSIDALARRLGFQKPSDQVNKYRFEERIENIIKNQFDLNKLNADITSSQIYSPLSCQILLDVDPGQPCQIDICEVREAVKIFPWRDGEIRINIEKDRVYEI